MPKRPAVSGEALIFAGEPDQYLPTNNPSRRPLPDDLESYRALRLVARFGVDPTLAFSLAALAFGGGR